MKASYNNRTIKEGTLSTAAQARRAQAPRDLSKPEIGFYKLRLVKGGPYVPAVIYRPCSIEFEPETFQWIDRFHRLRAAVSEEPASPAFVWTRGVSIDWEEYQHLLNVKKWAEEAYWPPEARPLEAVDIEKLPIWI